jgi:hypothetical protein
MRSGRLVRPAPPWSTSVRQLIYALCVHPDLRPLSAPERDTVAAYSAGCSLMPRTAAFLAILSLQSNTITLEGPDVLV